MNFNDNQLFETNYSKNDCISSNNTINNLWNWARKLEMFGIVGIFVLLAIGIITSISSAKTVEQVYSHTKETFSASIFIVTLLQWIIYAFIEYCSFHAVALIISAIGNITYNTMVTAKASLMTADPISKKTAADSTQSDSFSDTASANSYPAYSRAAGKNEWKCVKCGRINALYVGTCACGQTKMKNKQSTT